MSPLAWQRTRSPHATAGGEPAEPFGRTLRREEPALGLDQAVRLLAERVGVQAIDTLWLFPPRARGRTEQGLVVAGCFEAGEPRRRVVTAVYRAEQTAKGIQVDTQFFEEGIAAPERLSGIIDGVVERGEEQPGEPRRVEIGGASERLVALLAELAR